VWHALYLDVRVAFTTVFAAVVVVVVLVLVAVAVAVVAVTVLSDIVNMLIF
jgi:hypothetical protein